MSTASDLLALVYRGTPDHPRRWKAPGVSVYEKTLFVDAAGLRPLSLIVEASISHSRELGYTDAELQSVLDIGDALKTLIEFADLVQEFREPPDDGGAGPDG